MHKSFMVYLDHKLTVLCTNMILQIIYGKYAARCKCDLYQFYLVFLFYFKSEFDVSWLSLPAFFYILISLKLVFSDGDIVSFSSRDDGRCGGSTIYRLDITKIELFSVYGVQACIIMFLL